LGSPNQLKTSGSPFTPLFLRHDTRDPRPQKPSNHLPPLFIQHDTISTASNIHNKIYHQFLLRRQRTSEKAAAPLHCFDTISPTPRGECFFLPIFFSLSGWLAGGPWGNGGGGYLISRFTYLCCWKQLLLTCTTMLYRWWVVPGLLRVVGWSLDNTGGGGGCSCYRTGIGPHCGWLEGVLTHRHGNTRVSTRLGFLGLMRLCVWLS
jgi:hypothetical protein